jgi:hypothetical protein
MQNRFHGVVLTCIVVAIGLTATRLQAQTLASTVGTPGLGVESPQPLAQTPAGR